MPSPSPFVLAPDSLPDRLRGLLAGAGRQRAAVALLVLLALAAALVVRVRAAPTALPGGGAALGALPRAAPAGAAAPVAVDVVGRVRRPGLVRLAAGSRVADAIRAAGGTAPGARVDAVNLARKVVDGEQIRVPARGEPLAAAAGVGAGAAGTAAPGVPAGPVDLNSATPEQLDTLPGVGEVTAGRIVAYRAAHPFTSVDQLQDVPGIGERRFEQLKDLVTVG
jgi:competence protein ComEA